MTPRSGCRKTRSSASHPAISRREAAAASNCRTMRARAPKTHRQSSNPAAGGYLRFCRMMLNGGTLDGVQILSPKTVALFSLNYLPDNKEIIDLSFPGMFSESSYAGERQIDDLLVVR